MDKLGTPSRGLGRPAGLTWMVVRTRVESSQPRSPVPGPSPNPCPSAAAVCPTKLSLLVIASSTPPLHLHLPLIPRLSLTLTHFHSLPSPPLVERNLGSQFGATDAVAAKGGSVGLAFLPSFGPRPRLQNLLPPRGDGLTALCVPPPPVRPPGASNWMRSSCVDSRAYCKTREVVAVVAQATPAG